MRTAKTLIRLGECPGWSESSLGAQSLCWFYNVAAQIQKLNLKIITIGQYDCDSNKKYSIRYKLNIFMLNFELRVCLLFQVTAIFRIISDHPSYNVFFSLSTFSQKAYRNILFDSIHKIVLIYLFIYLFIRKKERKKRKEKKRKEKKRKKKRKETNKHQYIHKCTNIYLNK